MSSEKQSGEAILSKLTLKKELRNHSNWVNSLCILKDGRLVSASEDGSIKIFSLSNYDCLATLTRQDFQPLFVSQLDNGYLIASSFDFSICIWDVSNDSNKFIKSIEGHALFVSKVIQLSKHRIGSSSFDKTIRIWNDSEPYECIKILLGHENAVTSIIELKSGKYIVSGGFKESQIRFWNNETYECEKALDCICCWNNGSLQEISGDKILVGNKGEIAIVDSVNFKVNAKITEPSLGISFCFEELSDGSVLCGCEKGQLAILDPNENKIKKVREGIHEGNINSIVLKDNLVITCASDKLVKIWNF